MKVKIKPWLLGLNHQGFNEVLKQEDADHLRDIAVKTEKGFFIQKGKFKGEIKSLLIKSLLISLFPAISNPSLTSFNKNHRQQNNNNLQEIWAVIVNYM